MDGHHPDPPTLSASPRSLRSWGSPDSERPSSAVAQTSRRRDHSAQVQSGGLLTSERGLGPEDARPWRPRARTPAPASARAPCRKPNPTAPLPTSPSCPAQAKNPPPAPPGVGFDGPTPARLYLEAHQLAAGGRATDPLALAAHDIRDVLMRLHQAAATPGQSYVEVSRTAYHQLRDAWEDAREALAAFRTREEAVDDPTDRFLSAAERLLGVSGPLQAKKAKVFDDFLNKSDPARHLVPQTARR